MRKTQLTLAIGSLFSAVAAANHITPDEVSKDFAVEPAAVQKMYDEIALSSELLQKINIIGKTEKIGEIIGLSSGLIGSNTDTSAANKTRSPRSIHSLSSRKYLLEKTNFDVALRYDEIDGWAAVAKISPPASTRKLPNPSPSACLPSA